MRHDGKAETRCGACRLLVPSAAVMSPMHLLGCSTPEMYHCIPALMLSPCAPAATPVRPSPADAFFGSTLRGASLILPVKDT